MSATNSFESEILRHILLNEAISDIGDSNGLPESATPGNIYVCLLTDDPGEEGSIENEADYDGYERLEIERGSTEWEESEGTVQNKNVLSFSECSGGANDISYFGICKTSNGDDMIWYGELPNILYVTAGVRPQYNIGQMAISID